ncbi:Uncharacterized protein OBRU01_01726 [Operophtera brumata]|uniref:Uncharacterized protein n=1 Tax=Operophtera brumata TaxID=104452 RepID=A0A0L7LUB5_OPEBR|nr:Uncharacterized protein OBRU01_01726 [Operophtera brumata]
MSPPVRCKLASGAADWALQHSVCIRTGRIHPRGSRVFCCPDCGRSLAPGSTPTVSLVETNQLFREDNVGGVADAMSRINIDAISPEQDYEALPEWQSSNQELAKLLQDALDKLAVKQPYYLAQVLADALDKLAVKQPYYLPQALADALDKLAVKHPYYLPQALADALDTLAIKQPYYLPQALTYALDRGGGGGGGGGMFGDVNISSILDSFSISYDKRVRPNYGGQPVEVGITMYVLSISSLSEVQMVTTYVARAAPVSHPPHHSPRGAALGHTHCALVAGPPVEVGVTMYVLSISSVSEVLMVLIELPLSLVPVTRGRRRSSPKLEVASMYAFGGSIRFLLCLSDPLEYSLTNEER